MGAAGVNCNAGEFVTEQVEPRPVTPTRPLAKVIFDGAASIGLVGVGVVVARDYRAGLAVEKWAA